MATLTMCARTRCERLFEKGAPDLLYCPECRQAMLATEAAGSAQTWRNREALATTKFYETLLREQWDWQLLDETNTTVWASDLAKRYRAETLPRPSRSPSKF